MLVQHRELRALGRILQSYETLPKQSLERLAEQRISALRFHLTTSTDRNNRVLNPSPQSRSWPKSGGVGGFSSSAHERASLQRLARWHKKGLDGAAHVSASAAATTPEELIRVAERIASSESWVVAAPTKVITAAWIRLSRPEAHLWVATAPDWTDCDLPLVRAFGAKGVEFCALECPRGSAHFQLDRFYPEWDVVDPATTRQELLVTDLDSRLTPHIRIRMGVSWRLSWDLCPCGVTLPVLVTE